MGMLGVEDTLTGIAKRLFDVMKEGAMNPNPTDEDIRKFWRRLNDVGRSSNERAVSQAQTQVKEALTKHLMASGTMNAGDADKWFLSNWYPMLKAVNMADQKRRYDMDREDWAKAFWKRARVTGGIMLGGLVLLGIIRTAGNSPSTSSGPVPSIQQQTIDAFRTDALQPSQIQKTTVIVDQFNLMIGGMLAVEAAPPRYALPAAVAAVAAEPVAVEVTTQESGTHEYQSTLGQVYRNSPQSVQRQIEQEAPHIDHGYDHPSANSCVVTDCLDQHREQWNRGHNAQERHKEFTITPGDAFSHIRVSY
jgi:hypothetical protein